MKWTSIVATVAVGSMLAGCKPFVEDTSTSSTSGGDVTSTETPATGFDVVNDPTPVSGGDDQAPAPVPTPTPAPPTESNHMGSFSINSGDAYTKESSVHLSLFYDEPVMMKISDNGSCTGGTWEEYAESKDVALSVLNQNVNLSVQYTDYDAVVSNCFSDSIVHDSQGPNILISKYPMAITTEGDAAELIYEVSDLGIGVKDVTCAINGVVKPCPSGHNTVTTDVLVRGNYTFAVTASDKLGNSSTQSVSWSVSARNRAVTSTYHVNDYKKVDILFVIDNSGSMAYEQKSMAKRVSNFMTLLPGLDWQIAVTTTDPRSAAIGGDGQFLKFTGLTNQYIINSSMDPQLAQTVLGNTLQRPETGSGSEQGINAVYRAVSRSQSNSNPQHVQFFREGAAFAVVVISDEDESDNRPANDPGNLLNLIGTVFHGQKNFTFHSIITIPKDTQCLNGEGESYGTRYETISKMTSGIVGSVCASDYAAQVQNIANDVRNMVKALTLSCQPVPGTTVSVKRNGTAYTGLFHLDGIKILFDDVLAEGDFSVEYSCAAE